jgi:hypothetical protein
MRAEHEVRSDYDRARRKAFWRHIGSWLRRRGNDLLAFDEVRHRLRAHAQWEGGMREVPIAQIVGSVGRYRDFDRAFLPTQVQTKGRWLNIDRAHHAGTDLPPIELYRIGETYFVKDGNHRVSVAREHGQAFIDARVIEVAAPTPVSSVGDLLEWVRQQDAVEFFARTELARLRPGADVRLTLPGQYEKLLEHVDTHRWYRGVEEKREIPYAEAVASWYDRVYMPLVRVIRKAGALAEFPNRSEADLYLWVQEHHWYLHQSGALSKGHGIEALVRRYSEAFSERPVKRLKRVIRRRAGT